MLKSFETISFVYAVQNKFFDFASIDLFCYSIDYTGNIETDDIYVEPPAQELQQFIPAIYECTLVRLRATDMDQEVKERAIAACGQLLCHFGDFLQVWTFFSSKYPLFYIYSKIHRFFIICLSYYLKLASSLWIKYYYIDEIMQYTIEEVFSQCLSCIKHFFVNTYLPFS